MQFGIMSTDGGTHPPEKWATMSAGVVFQFDAQACARENPDLTPAQVGQRIMAAERLRLAIAEAFVGVYGDHQAEEVGHLEAKGEDHLEAGHDPTERAMAGVETVRQLAAGTPWEAHFEKPEVQAAVFAELASHLATAAKEERMQFADQAGTATAADWKAKLTQEGVGLGIGPALAAEA